MHQHGLAEVREAHAGRPAFEHRRAQRALQFLDHLRDGRLRHVQRLGHLAEVRATAGHAHQLQLGQAQAAEQGGDGGHRINQR